ncbi:hypothetical protein B6I21_00910 [candidate division KSB1 bacterium 4572_119]|nr:MAG: hypothetical protein B6I21_00910 [candidate division KSB1 bacterium 4572_119]
MKNTKPALLILFCLFLFTSISFSQTADKLVINGYAGWGYGKSDENNYLLGTENGKYANYNLALAIASNPADRVNIFSSFDLQRRHEDNITGTYSSSQPDKILMKINYIFAEYTFNDAVRFRVGKVKAPFGLYTETFNVGTTRPFFTLPTSIYASPGLVTQSYLGVGITGSYYFENNWGFQYDVYGGELNLERYADFTNPTFPAIVDTRLPDMFGLRLICHTGLDGLNIGVSGYMGAPEFFYNGVKKTNYFISGKHMILDFHLEYLTDAISLRSEYERIQKNDGKDVEVDGYYVEAAYKLFGHWQAAALYDKQNYIVHDPVFSQLIALNPSTVKHEEWAFGLNYWFTPNFVIKFSYHMVDGNLFAKPKDIMAAMINNEFEEKTNLLLVGTQFSF